MLPFELREFCRNVVLPTAGIEQVGALTVAAAATLTADSNRLIYLDATVAGFTLNLPASAYEGLTFVIAENVDSANAVIVSGNGYTINGAASFLFNAARRIRCFRFNGTEYRILWGYN
jgi:hypothetical protein